MNDNVKKIFDMLGIEPKEKFKLKGNDNDLYCLTENLIGYLFDEKENKCDFMGNWLLRDILINPEIIVKLPKEPKKNKKKLRDLTEEDYKKWLKKNCKPALNSCNGCVFANVVCYRSFEKYSWVNNKELYSDAFLNQEIEVE